jgi:hypothetical protein
MKADIREAEEIIGELSMFLPKLIEATEVIADQFYGDVNAISWQLFGDVVTAIDDLYRTLQSLYRNADPLSNEYISDKVIEIEEKFTELNRFVDLDQYVHAGDILRLTFLPLFHSLNREIQPNNNQQLFDKNMSFFKEKMPHIFNLIHNLERNVADYQFCVSEDGESNIQVRTHETVTYMYSRYNIKQELDHWLMGLREEASQARQVLMFGVGLTHHLKAFSEAHPRVELFIVEPDPQLFLASLYVNDWAEFCKKSNIHSIVVGTEQHKELAFLLDRFCYKTGTKLYIQDTWFYSKHYKNEKLQILKQLKNSAKKFRINENTVKFRYLKYGENIFQNIAMNLATPSIRSLRDRFSGKTAIIVGAGPSLEADVEHLKTVRESVLIIAAGTAIQSLLHFGIKPHFIVSIDGMEANYDAFKHIDRSDIPLIYLPQIEYRISNHQKEKTWHAFLRDDQISKYIMGFEAKDPLFVPTNSVTGTAVQIAIFLGVRKIIFTGQDLSYPVEDMYAPGALHVDKEAQKQTVTMADEWVENNKGTLNKTSAPMMLTLRNIERLLGNFPQVDFINSSTLGAKIEHTRFVPLQELLNDLTRDTDGMKDFDEILNNNEILYPEQREREIIKRVKALPAFVEQVEKEAVIIQKKLRDLPGLSRMNPNKALKVMAKIEDHWGKIVNSIPFIHIYGYTLKSSIEDFDRFVNGLSIERNILKKAKMFEEVLGKLLSELLKQSPEVLRFTRDAVDKIEAKRITG